MAKPKILLVLEYETTCSFKLTNSNQNYFNTIANFSFITSSRRSPNIFWRNFCVLSKTNQKFRVFQHVFSVFFIFHLSKLLPQRLSWKVAESETIQLLFYCVLRGHG